MRARLRRYAHLLIGMLILFATLFAASTATGHPATERYIPIGQSPGVSFQETTVGVIEAVDAPARTITVSSSGGAVVVPVTDATMIWLDRSKVQRTTLNGRFADLRAGATVEVKLVGPEGDAAAEWIKLESSDTR